MAQRAHRARVRYEDQFYHQVLAAPVLLNRYSAMARRRGIPLPVATLSLYSKATRQ